MHGPRNVKLHEKLIYFPLRYCHVFSCKWHH